jgi:predicted CXXCH cytochrome family protein
MVGSIGGDLRGDHPVSFVYDSLLAEQDGQLSNPATAPSGLGSTIAEDMLVGGKMECTSCHNVHDSAGPRGLLHKSNAGSALCMTCHEI